jgi:hypothetical protein
MKTKITQILFLLTFISVHVEAKSDIVHTVGMHSCRAWIENKTENSALYFLDKATLLGYLSGLNVALSDASHDSLNSVDVKSLYLWMDNYCQKNPLNDVSDGGKQLFRELREMKKK